LSEVTKIKKNYKLLGTESDPVIIAQRLLNLYRQLHIFSQEKKEAYNQMLLEQTPEVKRMLGNLPGGVVLQQYLADIEEEYGLEVEDFSIYHGADKENVQEEIPLKTHKSTPVAPAVTIASDPNMVQGIVEAFKEAMITSEKNRKEDTKELAQTIVALQSKLTQTIRDKNSGNVVNTAAPQPANLDEIISSISKAQGELIKEVAQVQTKELSQIISDVLKEIQKMSTQNFISALQAVNINSLDLLKNNLAGSVSMTPVQQDDVETINENKDIPESNNDEETVETTETTQVSEDEYVAPIDIDASDDYEWEYVEDGDELNTEEYEYVEVSDYDSENDSEYSEEYEWEYVEEDLVSDNAIDTNSQVADPYADPYAIQIIDNTGQDNLSLNDNESIDLGEDFGLYSS